MKLTEAQRLALEAIFMACKHRDPMSYPPRVTSDMEDPRGVCGVRTARSLKKKGLVEWNEWGSSISLTAAGTELVKA
jgi:hypothetical protein